MNLENASKETYLKTNINEKEIHAISPYKSEVANKANGGSFIKSCKYSGEGHNQGQCPAKEKHPINVIGYFANKCRSSNRSHHRVQVHRHRSFCRVNQLQQSDHYKVQRNPILFKVHMIHLCKGIH